MTSGAWDLIRSAIATKLDASAGCTAAGLRAADANTDEPMGELPHIRVGQPRYSLLDRPVAHQERYTLTFEADLYVPVPSVSRKRSNPIAAAIARAVQVEFQSGVKLGGLVDDCRMTDWDDTPPGDADGLDGGTFTFEADVTEYLATPRSA